MLKALYIYLWTAFTGILQPASQTKMYVYPDRLAVGSPSCSKRCETQLKCIALFNVQRIEAEIGTAAFSGAHRAEPVAINWWCGI